MFEHYHNPASIPSIIERHAELISRHASVTLEEGIKSITTSYLVSLRSVTSGRASTEIGSQAGGMEEMNAVTESCERWVWISCSVNLDLMLENRY